MQTRKVELKTRKDTADMSALQKCADFVTAFMLGFSIQDAIAMLRLDDLYIESFEIKVREKQLFRGLCLPQNPGTEL